MEEIQFDFATILTILNYVTSLLVMITITALIIVIIKYARRTENRDKERIEMLKKFETLKQLELAIEKEKVETMKSQEKIMARNKRKML